MAQFYCPGHVARSCQNPSLQGLPTPDPQAKLQSFLGLINYLHPFISGLSVKTTFLQEQLAEWDWNPSTDTAFQCLKASICQTLLSATLAYYDRSMPVIVQMYASEYGLEATLIQSGHPIAFASKMLTNIEIHYVNIKRECLLVCFGLDEEPVTRQNIRNLGSHKLCFVLKRL